MNMFSEGINWVLNNHQQPKCVFKLIFLLKTQPHLGKYRKRELGKKFLFSDLLVRIADISQKVPFEDTNSYRRNASNKSDANIWDQY